MNGDVEKEIIGIDEEVLAKKRELCCVAAMVYNEVPTEKQTEVSDEVKMPALSGDQIAMTYRTLNHIETCSVR